MTDPTASFFAALDEWGRWLVLLHTCDPANEAERTHRERMLRQCRSNMELALRHLMMTGPRRSASVRMTAVQVDVVEQHDEDEKKR